MGMAPGMGMGYNMGVGFNPNDANKVKLVTLTRTDFLIQFVWQPPKPGEGPQTPEELQAKIDEATKQLSEAQKDNSVVVIPKESEIEAASRKSSQEVENALNKAVAAPPAGVAPATAPAK